MKTSKMIAMLEENPKLRFKNTRPNGIETDIFISDYGYFNAVVTRNGEVKDCTKGLYNFFGNFKPNADWQLVREPVTWQEAIQAWLDGKEIEIRECAGCDCQCSVKNKEKIIGDAGSLEMICREQLKTAKWYINE